MSRPRCTSTFAGARSARRPVDVDKAPTATALHADKATAAHAHAKQPGPPAKEPVRGVRNIIAVASGKGGVGKSTTAVNLALAFAGQGLRTGVLDADLYGPSIPKLLGIEGKPAVRADGIFSPHQAFGLKAISIGSMLTPALRDFTQSGTGRERDWQAFKNSSSHARAVCP